MKQVAAISKLKAMEIREFAEAILFSESIEVKLETTSKSFRDRAPGEARFIEMPARPPNLRFDKHRRGAQMPSVEGLRESRLRAVAHHIMANHELQALESMAWLLIAFPDAPAEFRQEVAHVMFDEQRHTRMHIGRLETMGLKFGDKPVNGQVWLRTTSSRSLLDYLARLPLAFEGGNLDLSLEFAERFESAGDSKSASVMRAIHEDEITHVSLGVRWLRKLKPAGQSDWDAFTSHLGERMKPRMARGKDFQREARIKAGLDEDSIRKLEEIYEG